MILSTLVAAAVSLGPISESDVRVPVQTLASAEMEGRFTMSPGGDRACDFIVGQIRSYGLLPGQGKSYVHEFPVSFSQRPTAACKVVVRPEGKAPLTLKLDVDYRPLVNTASKPVDAPVVYAGYGLDREDWNDFAGLDVKGKIVLMLRGVPDGQRPISTGTKARTAAEMGAVGVIFAGPTAKGKPDLPAYVRAQGMPPDLDVAGIGISSKAFESITGLDYWNCRGAAGPERVTLDISARIEVEMVPNKGFGKNVVGILPGRDPKLKSEYIIIGAHYDHLGFGQIGSMTGSDAIHYGADDNASGSAAVMAIAKAFAKAKSNKRTLIFQWYQGEELGLLGSTAWAKDHPDILRSTSAMINLDMVGRVREGKIWIYGVGTAKEWQGLIDGIDRGALKPQLVNTTRGDSDHASFGRYNIPHVFFFSGIHPDYHTERDTVDKLNIDGIAETANFAARLISSVDALPARLTYASASLDSRPQSSGQGRRVRIGFIPDMAGEGPGVVLTGVSPGSPAEKAGLKAGDRIVMFNGVRIDDLQGLQDEMMKVEPGAKVKVVYERAGEKFDAEIITESRSQ